MLIPWAGYRAALLVNSPSRAAILSSNEKIQLSGALLPVSLI